MEENLILKPSYLKEFKCLEGKCLDSCYLYREVFLTKLQYEKYKKVEIEGIDFNDIVSVLGKKKTDDRYAKIRIRKDIDITIKEYLNTINLELGYEYLPNVYKFSPIYFNIINGAFEEVGNLACPAVSNLVLFKKEGIGLINEEMTDVEKSVVHKDIVTLGSENLIMKYFWDIRVNSLNILLNDKYTLEERLLLLGIFYEHLDILNNPENIDLVPEKMEELLSFFDTKNYQIYFKRLPRNEYLNLEILKYILDINFKEFENNIYVEDMEINLKGFLPRTDLIDLRTIYFENKKIYDDFIIDKEYILENYIINEFLKDAIPYMAKGKLKELYDNMMADFIVLKVILIGNSVYSGRLNENMILDKIVSYSRFKIKSPEFINIVENFLNIKQYNSIETLSLIFNN